VNEPLFSLKNRWFTFSVGGVVLIAAAAIAVGFIWVPRVHAEDARLTLWDAICSAAGVPARYSNPPLQGPDAVLPTSVIVNSTMMGPHDNIAIGRGATLALRCTMCHGARGTSPAGTDAPHLAGQPASSTYKQLRDFKSGHRPSTTMQALAANLSDRDMRDLAAFYATQQRDSLVQNVGLRTEVPRLVSNGAPMRNIGVCSACHDPGERRAATPVLDGMAEPYLRHQLESFRSGHRANDINRQMRNAAHQMSDAEIAEVARYYARR
jgi:cytochrome c553